MPAITVKNIPEPIYESLKLAAQAHHRSINSEIIACLEKELMLEKVTIERKLENARKLRAKFKANLAHVKEIDSAIEKGRI